MKYLVVVFIMLFGCLTAAPPEHICPITKAMVNHIVEFAGAKNIEGFIKEMQKYEDFFDTLHLSDKDKCDIFRSILSQVNIIYDTNFTEHEVIKQLQEIIPLLSIKENNLYNLGEKK